MEEETTRRFGRLPPAACDFFAAAKLRIDCKRRGIVRLDVGPEAVAATFLPGRLRKSKSKSLARDGDRVVYASNGHDKPFERVEEFLEILDERRALLSPEVRVSAAARAGVPCARSVRVRPRCRPSAALIPR